MVTLKLDAEKNKTFIEFSSSDYLKGIEAEIDGRKERLELRKNFKRLEYPFEIDWLQAEAECLDTDMGLEKERLVRLHLEFKEQPYSVALKLKADRAFTVEGSNLKFSHKKNQTTIRWFGFPERTLEAELRILLPQEAELEAEIEADFLETPLSVKCSGKHKQFIYRAAVARKLDIFPGEQRLDHPEAGKYLP